MVFTVLLVIVVVVLGAAGGVVNNLAPCLMINREKYLEMDRIYDKTQQPVHILIYRQKTTSPVGFAACCMRVARVRSFTRQV